METRGGCGLDIVLFGFSISSSWGDGHATTYRSLTQALHARGHRVRFFERNVPWYARARDLRRSPYCTIELYADVGDLRRRAASAVRRADVVILGSYVPLRLWNWRGIDVVNAHERASEVYVRGMRDGVELLRAGALDLAPLVSHRFALAEIDRAFAAASGREAGFVKAIVEPGSAS